MDETDVGPTEKPHKIVLDLPGIDKETAKGIHMYIETVINLEMQNLANYFRLREKNIMSMLESIQSAMEFNTKELNFKIGALKGQQEKTRKKVEEDSMPSFSTMEEAEEYAAKVKSDLLKKAGIKSDTP